MLHDIQQSASHGILLSLPLSETRPFWYGHTVSDATNESHCAAEATFVDDEAIMLTARPSKELRSQLICCYLKRLEFVIEIVPR